MGSPVGLLRHSRIHPLRNVLILAGAGVGDGSLNYANTLYVPPEPFFNDLQWAQITDWRSELMPHYEQAKRMLGVVTNPTFTDADRIINEVADEMGCGDTFVQTGRRVLRPGIRLLHDRVPSRRQEHPAEKLPRARENCWAQVLPMTTVKGFEQRPDGLWQVHTVRTCNWVRRNKRTFTASHLILAAGTWGT